MDLFELELERRLARRNPAPGFSERMMQAVRTQANPEPAAAWGRGAWSKAWGWGLTGALAASLAVGVFFQNRRVERRAAEQAEAELIDALFVTGEKIQIARTRAGGGAAPGGN